ncbi:hypothetical protein AAHZ94_06640 [Streptomyces sp. HSW2009]|uniref:hypothetical protein n=1 Tax=Streptomyces sp. HSW2009 TaxID=3142890 RepID=UPI0032ECBD12
MAEDPRPYSDDMTQGDQAAQLRRRGPGLELPDEAKLLAASVRPTGRRRHIRRPAGRR